MASSGPPSPNSRDEFEIAIVCALAIEYDAVSLLIDQFWDEDGDKYGRASGDYNTYTTGRMGRFDVVLALLPETGKVSAASAASSIRSSFPGITLALVVGTCGGVPYTKDNEEILLGDVVISKTVIQYDLGRRYGEEFLTNETVEDRLGRPGTNIRSILAAMETNQGRERLENRAAVLLDQLQRHAGQKKTRKLVKYEYPGILKDLLFEPNYVHKHQVLLPHRCCEEAPCHLSHTLSCEVLGCEEEHLVQRQRLQDHAQNFSIFIGRFGSGDTMLKSGTYRDQVAQRYGLLAFEMEGAGVWDELPCIIVKGISDYADSHWNAGSGWQHFAAATAAATARALIERYPKTDKPPCSSIIVQHHQRTKEDDECLRDMHVTDPALDKKRIEDTNGGLLKDSYIWILSNAEFIRWHESRDGGLLWIKGDPGKGKTMLLCGLIDELQTDGATRPYYFFCQASDSRLNSATKVLCSLIYSIACENQQALSYIMEKYKHTGKELFYNINAWSALSQIMTHILQNMRLKDKVFIIDGLDECVTDLPLLLDLIAQAPGLSEAKWIVSSRNWPNIEEKLNASVKKLPLSLELNEQSISDAVCIYIQHKVNQLAIRKNLDESFRGIVQTHLTNNANGTFLWVSLVCKKLLDWDVRKRHLQDLMKAFPSGLMPLYERMMTQVCNSTDASICIQVLELISLTYRPISLMELASFVQLMVDDDDFEELKNIVATCGSFLVLKEDVVYFVHQSAKDFLLKSASKRIFTGGIARKHHDIFSRSIQLLSQTLRRDMYNLRHPAALPSVPNPDPLASLQYACLYWVDHLRDTDIGSSGNTVSQTSLQDEGAVHSFIKAYLLYWLEALCLMRKLSEGILAVKTLMSMTAQDRSQLHLFTCDARRLLLTFRSAIEYTPLQLYSSALRFAPTSSIVRQTFEPNMAKWIVQMPSVQLDWDACLQTLEAHPKSIESLIFSPDKTKLASYSNNHSSGDNNLMIWNLVTGACLQSRMLDRSVYAPGMAFSPDSSQFALALKKCIEIWDINAGACVMTLDGSFSLSYRSLMFSLNGMQIMASDELWEDECFQIWDLATKMQLEKEKYYQDVREPVVFHIDADAPNVSEITIIRSPVTGSCVHIATCNDDSFWRVLFSSDGLRFALFVDEDLWKTNDSRAIYILDVATGKCLHKFDEDLPLAEDLNWALSPDGTQLAMVDEAGHLRIWDVDTSASLLISSGDCAHPVFSPDGMELAFALDGDTIKIWDLNLGSAADTQERRQIESITYSPDSTRFAFITDYIYFRNSFAIEIWDPLEAICQQKLQVGSPATSLCSSSGDTTRLAFSPDNTQLAYSRGNEITIRDLATSTCQNWFDFKSSGSIQSIVFTPCGTRIAVADIPRLSFFRDIKTSKIETPKIEIRDATNGRVIYTFYVENAIIDMQFSSDGKRLGSASNKGIAAIWDLDTGARLQTLDFNFEKISFAIKDWSHKTRLIYYLPYAQYQFFVADMLQNPGPGHAAIFEFNHSLNCNWLLRRGEPFLWLPLEYRPTNMTFSRGNVTLMLSDFTHLSLCFSLAELDAEMESNKSIIEV